MKRILIIEDNEEVRENLEEVLELSGYEVDSAENGKIGVERALASPPHLILCDVMMPVLDGFGVLNIVSKKPALKKIPFIFLTAKSETADFRRGMNLGADDYVTKPFFKDDLLRVIEIRLDKSKSNDDPAQQLKLPDFDYPEKGYEVLENHIQTYPEKSYSNKSIIFPEETLLHQLYWVEKGRVKLSKTDEYGKEYIYRIVGVGGTFGFSSLFRNLPTGFSATAISEAEIKMLPKDHLFDLMMRESNVNFYFLHLLSNNLHFKETQLVQLAYQSIRKRVAESILLLAKQSSNHKVELSRDDLAHVVGTAKESLVRALSEFKKDGLVRLDGNVIEILDESALKNYMG